MDARGECVEQRGASRCVGGIHLRLQIAEAVQDQRAEHDRRENPGDLVADAHEGDALRGAFDRSEDADVRIRGRLQQ